MVNSGYFKRKRSFFQKAHIPQTRGLQHTQSQTSEAALHCTRPIRRLTTAEELPSVSVNSTSRVRFSTCTDNPSAMLLRPVDLKPEIDAADQRNEQTHGNRVIDSDKMVEMLTKLCASHAATDCEQVDFFTSKNQKWGLGWKYAFECRNCDFKSETFNLYEEIKTNLPGPNAASTNVGLQAGLLDTPIGNTRMRMLLTSMNIPPPARSAMNKTANKVSELVIQTNTQDMCSKTDLLMNTLTEFGCTADIHGAFDGRYNSIAIVSHKKPGQNASQAIGVFAETMTDCHWIIDYSVENKLCATGSHLRSHGFQVECPGGHDGCTATIPSVAPHSEYEMAKDIAVRMEQRGVRVNVITTDGDSKAQNAFSDVYMTMFPDFTIVKQKDTIHLGRSQIRKALASNFSDTMFPGTRTKESIRQAKVTFCRDVKARSSLIYNSLYERSGGDMRKLTPTIFSRALEATISCYSGDCTSCRQHSIVCGGGQRNSWWERSAFLGPSKISVLRMTENDKHLLREVLKMRLSAAAVTDTRYGFNTQQCESFNFSLSKSAPKNTNYPRNFEARCASAILRYNNGQGQALKMKLKDLGIHLSPFTERALDKIGSDMRAHRHMDKSALKKRIMKRRGEMQYRYQQYKTKKDARVCDYKKKYQADHDHQYPSTSGAGK